MQRLLLLGLNHTTAPLDVRERLAFDAEQRRAAVAAFRERFPAAEAVLLSTCNRVELYVGRQAHDTVALDEMVEFLAEFHDVPAERLPGAPVPEGRPRGRRAPVHASPPRSTRWCSARRRSSARCATRTTRARDCRRAGALLNPLFQRAIAVGKQVMHETPLAEGRLSVASVAVDYAQRIFEHFGDKTVLCVGAGQDGDAGAAELRRPLARPAAGLQPRPGQGRRSWPAQFERHRRCRSTRLDDHLVAADIVVTSTGSAQPIITRELVRGLLRQRRYRPIFLIDIAVPRDVEPAVGELENVYLYNLDDLQQVVGQHSRPAHRRDRRRPRRSCAGTSMNSPRGTASASWARHRPALPAATTASRRRSWTARSTSCRTFPRPTRATWRIWPAGSSTSSCTTRSAPCATSEGQHSGLTYLHAMEKLFDLEKADDDREGAPPADDPAVRDPGGPTKA